MKKTEIGIALNADPNELAARHGLNGKVTICNRFVTNQEKDLFFSAVDMAVLSYKPEFKCTSSMLWETSAYGIPVVASGINALAEDVEKYQLGLLFKPGDAEDLRLAINAVGLLDKMQIEANCQKFADDHSSQKWAGKCKSIYGRLSE